MIILFTIIKDVPACSSLFTTAGFLQSPMMHRKDNYMCALLNNEIPHYFYMKLKLPRII